MVKHIDECIKNREILEKIAEIKEKYANFFENMKKHSRYDVKCEQYIISDELSQYRELLEVLEKYSVFPVLTGDICVVKHEVLFSNDTIEPLGKTNLANYFVLKSDIYDELRVIDEILNDITFEA